MRTPKIVLALNAIISGTFAATLVHIDCHKEPDLCKNDCWHRNCVRGAGVQGTGHIDLQYRPDLKTANRKTSGYTPPGGSKNHPCKLDGDSPNAGFWAAGNHFRATIEEYPFASVGQGGEGASLRCAPPGQQSSKLASKTRVVPKTRDPSCSRRSTFANL